MMTTYYADPLAQLIHGDCLEVMAQMEKNSIDAIVTDPPYLLGFMGKEWDKGGQDFHRRWAEQAYRVLKPGGHMLVAGIGRTHHRMMCGVEDAGFEVRDVVYHFFGSGFPKSLDVSKAIDKAAGVERKIVRSKTITGMQPDRANFGANDRTGGKGMGFRPGEIAITAPATDAAKQWQGWGTALKPAAEVWVLFRKPLSERNVALNVQRWGTGAINVDGCRVAHDEAIRPMAPQITGHDVFKQAGRYAETTELKAAGRWPPNVVFTHHPDCEMVGVKRVKSPGMQQGTAKVGFAETGNVYGEGIASARSDGYADPDGLETVPDWRCAEGCPVAELGRQSGESPPSFRHGDRGQRIPLPGSPRIGDGQTELGFHDTGTAARFFPQFAWEEADFWPFKYVAKTDRAERERGMAGQPQGSAQRWNKAGEWTDDTTPARNNHPTVKPLALMRWLITLITPPGGLVLDPFAGSGSTLVAAKELAFRSVGIEQLNDAEHPYCEIAKGRIIAAQPGMA